MKTLFLKYPTTPILVGASKAEMNATAMKYWYLLGLPSATYQPQAEYTELSVGDKTEVGNVYGAAKDAEMIVFAEGMSYVDVQVLIIYIRARVGNSRAIFSKWCSRKTPTAALPWIAPATP
jgi:hypothetical protein